MAASSRGAWLQIPRLKTFLGFISLQTGTELILISLLINKVTGLYGLLANLTSYSFSAIQLSMYIYSAFVLIAVALSVPHICKPTFSSSPFHSLALAWIYLVDTAINTVYTAAFAVSWYLASFHDPKGAAGAGSTTSDTTSGGRKQLDDAREVQASASVGPQETAASVVLIVALTLVRIYFAVIVMAYAGGVLRRYVEIGAGREGLEVDEARKGAARPEAQLWDDPFAEGMPAGGGWKGWLGRRMVSIGKGYWLGDKEDEGWTRETGSRFRVERMDGDGAAQG